MATVTIDKAYCKGCDICITVCPKKVFVHSKNRNKYGTNMPDAANAKECVQCSMCERMCPDGAIEVIGEEL